MEGLELKLLSGAEGQTVSTEKNRMDTIMRDLRKWDPFHNIPFIGHTGPVWSCAMTSDNSTLFSGSEDNSVKIWDVRTQASLGTLSGHTNCVNGLEVTPDDKLLISGDWDGKIFIWDWRNQEQVAELVGHTAGVYCFSMSRDGKFLVSGSGDNTAKIWNLEEKTLVASLANDENSVFGCAVTHDNKEVLIGGWGGQVKIFDFNSFESLSSFDPEAGVVQSLGVTGDKKYIIIGTRSNLVLVFNFSDKTECCRFTSHENWVRNVVIMSDNIHFITVSADKTIRVFNIRDKKEELLLEGSEGYVFGEYLSKDGKFLLTGASDKIMRLWDIGQGVRVRKLKGHKKTIMSLAVSKDNNYVVTGSEDQTICIWNIKNQDSFELTSHSGTVWGVALSNDMKFIASGSGDKTVKLWDFNDKHCIETFEGHTSPVFCVTISPDNKHLISGGQDKNLIVWSVHEKNLVKTLEGHTDTVFTAKVSNDGSLIISGAADYTIRIWDLKELRQAQKIETRGGMIESVALSFDDKYLVLGDRASKVQIWDWKQRKLIKKFHQHEKWVKCVSFSADGNIFASASNDSTVRLWNSKEERQEIILRGHVGNVRCVGFTSDGNHVISAGEDTSVVIWDIANTSASELTDIGGPIDSFLFKAKIKGKISPTKLTAQQVFSDLKINLAHIYAYLGYEDLLLDALRLGAEIRVDSEGHSPLFYALQRSTQGCIDNILTYMIEVKEENLETFLNYGNALRDDFAILLDNSSINLPEFLQAVYYKVPNMPNFAAPVQDLPIIHYSESRTLETTNFIYDAKTIPEDMKEIPVEFRSLPFSIHYDSGSVGSIDLLNSISECPNSKILETDFVQAFVRTKWNNLWLFTLFLTGLLWANVVLMSLLMILATFNGAETKPLEIQYIPIVIAYIAVNGLLTLYEVVQAMSTGWSYFISFWNITDMFRFSLCFSWSFLICIYSQDTPGLYYIGFFMIVINFFRSLSGFRAFDSTRFYTRLIFRSLGDSIAFVLIFFYSTAAFGMINYSSMDPATFNSPDFSLFSIWQAPYNLNMGDIVADPTPLQYAYFMLASVINVIIMLNLLISILGDSYESFQNEAKGIDCLEMAEFVIELETLMFWKRNSSEPKKFVQVCRDLESANSAEWEGRLKLILNSIQTVRKEAHLNFEKLNKKIDILINKK